MIRSLVLESSIVSEVRREDPLPPAIEPGVVSHELDVLVGGT